MPNVPEHLRSNVAVQFVQSQGWNWIEGTDGHIQIEVCPLCKKGDYKFYMNVEGNKTGCFMCFHGLCQKSGNLRTLQEELGIRIRGVDSRSEWGAKEKKIEALPDPDSCHNTLLGDADALDYLLRVRGFTQEIIDRQKIGLLNKHYFREAGEVRALVIPYLVNGNIVYAKYRTLPPSPKDFTAPTGHEAPLYNGEILVDGLAEVIFVEGEANTLCMMSNGIENAVGVPGANFKKAAWIETLDRIAPKRLFVMYDNDKAGIKAAQSLASRIGYDKCLRLVLPEFYVVVPADECKDCNGTGELVNGEVRIQCTHTRLGKDINEWFTKGGGNVEKFNELKAHAQLFDVTGVIRSGDALDEIEAELEGKVSLVPTYAPPWEPLSKLVGWENGDVIDIVAPEKIGKFLGADNLIKTPTGWIRNGDLRIGDELASVDGKSNFVTGVFPQGKKELFRVTFSDGRSTVAGGPHLWKIHGCTPWERGNDRVYTTDAIANEYCYPGCRRSQKVYVDLVSGDFGNDSTLPIDPWLLGVLIGDGGITHGQPRFTSSDESIVQRVSMKVMSLGDEVKFSERYSYRINGTNTKRLLTSLGLWGHKAEAKFIPLQYLNSNKEQRWELLRGLMDTDGTAGNKHGVISYCTVSEQLAKDFVLLVRSLGGIAKASSPQKKTFRYKGELKTGQPAYIIVVRLTEREKAFTLQRKLDRVKPRKHEARLTFSHIESIGFKDAVCISVSHPSKLYITDDYIVTHNTTFGLNIIEGMVDKYDEDGLIICLEMTQARLAKKWVSMVTNCDDSIPKTLEEGAEKLARWKQAIPVARAKAAARKGDIYFANPQIKDVEEVFKLIKDCVRRYGVKWVMFDNLQLLCDTTLGKNFNHRTIHLSQISKGLAKIAKDFNIKLIRILQPKRITPGNIVSTDDVDGSSQVAKDCDCMITLHRTRLGEIKKNDWETSQYMETEASFDSKMLVTVGLSRYSCGGCCTLEFLGNVSQVIEYNAARKAGMQAQQPNTNGYALPEESVMLPATAAQAGEMTI